MTDANQYQDIADRYQTSANALNKIVHEVSAFAAYHAFESIGAAWLRHIGRKVPTSHQSKLREFSVRSKPLKMSLSIAQMAIFLEGIRNKLLYPFLTSSGIYEVPQKALTQAESKKLVCRVGGIVRSVSRYL